MNTGIYIIRNRTDGKCYIGSAKNIKKRFSKHKRELHQHIHHNNKLQRAWDKYGEENFTFEKLLICKDTDLIMYEQRALDVYDVVNNGYNILPTAGSATGRIHSQETKLKMSESAKGRVISESQRKQISDANKNRVLSDETRAKMSAASKGVKKSEQTRLNMIEAHKKRSPEIGLKISAAKMGKKPSIESRNKMSESHKLRHIILKANGITVSHSEETRAKISASNSGKKRNTPTDIAKKNLSISMKASWVRRKLAMTATRAA